MIFSATIMTAQGEFLGLRDEKAAHVLFLTHVPHCVAVEWVEDVVWNITVTDPTASDLLAELGRDDVTIELAGFTITIPAMP